jgi:metal-responsive CopG/Arc/MetJ family transcriptional regulator
MGRKDWYYVHLPKLLIKRLDSFMETPRAKSMGMTNRPELLRRVINEFLEEQEKLYDGFESIEEVIFQIKEYDHLVITFNDKAQFQEIVISFVKRGINNNNLNVLFITREEEPEFIDALNKIKNVNSLFRSEQIMIVNADEYLQGGRYLVDQVMKKLGRIGENAKDRSKSGLSVIGTPPGLLIDRGKYDEAHKMEVQFHEAIHKSGIPATFLCLYRSLPQELEGRFSECHDLIVKRAVTATGLA